MGGKRVGRPPTVKFRDGVISVKVNGVAYKFKDGRPHLDTKLRTGTEDYYYALDLISEWEALNEPDSD